ncbi:MAG: xanthine dehydrogenase accessory protein XdhC [Planctomycetales bacterium]|nr:xanthine dehydrogenase accessory protein XdhC [Planctomycetales bacterium]
MTSDFVRRTAQLLDEGRRFVSVVLVDVQGSAPHRAGGKMLVDPHDRVWGTVGGGRIEMQAIEFAQAMLVDPTCPAHRYVEWNLHRDVGMTCGGTVRLYFEIYGNAPWTVAVFGAGHVASAVVRILATLECDVLCFDSRPEWIAQLPQSSRVRGMVCSELAERVDSLPDDAFVLCMTMGHRSDRPVLERILATQRRFPYVGVIGSRAKRAVLSKELEAAGFGPQALAQVHCPIGLPLGEDSPAEIAVSVVAQLIQQRDAWRSQGRES